MRLRWKILQFGVFAGLTFLATGCGGFHAKYGVSPLTFLLPGFGKVDAKPIEADTDIRLNEPVPESWDGMELVRTKELAQVENSQINF